jgi:uncharacterized protein (DUF1778 family)
VRTMSEKSKNNDATKGTRLWIRIEEDLKKRARRKAKIKEQTLSDYVRASVEAQVQRDEATA